VRERAEERGKVWGGRWGWLVEAGREGERRRRRETERRYSQALGEGGERGFGGLVRGRACVRDGGLWEGEWGVVSVGFRGWSRGGGDGGGEWNGPTGGGRD